MIGGVVIGFWDVESGVTMFCDCRFIFKCVVFFCSGEGICGLDNKIEQAMVRF